METPTFTPTPTPNGTVVGYTDGHLPIVVAQGPAFLARLLWNPPGWLNPLIGLLVVVTIGLAVVGYRRHGGLDPELLADMGQNVSIVAFALILTYMVRGIPGIPYVVDVAVGGVGGWVLAVVARHVVEEARTGRDADVQPE